MRHYSNYKHNRKQYRVVRKRAQKFIKAKVWMQSRQKKFSGEIESWWNRPTKGIWSRLNNSNYVHFRSQYG